jgi:hypothetical protein
MNMNRKMTLILQLTIILWVVLVSTINVLAQNTTTILAGVMLTTAKDTRVFEKSIQSALKYLIDLDIIYVITPDPKALADKVTPILKKMSKKEYSSAIPSSSVHPAYNVFTLEPVDRVKFIDEHIFPFSHGNVSEIMIEAVSKHGKYPLNGYSSFEKTMWHKTGWFLQQLLKLYAGEALNLHDFVLLDSDVIWFQNIRFYNNTNRAEVWDGLHASSNRRLEGTGASETGKTKLSVRYNYASSGQYHPSYMSTLKTIAKLEYFEPAPGDVFRSGIVHHMVIARHILRALIDHTESIHKAGNIDKPFLPPNGTRSTKRGSWLPKPGVNNTDNPSFYEILLAKSALEMTCKAPRDGLCGSGSTLSEYEMYFNFARTYFPDSVAYRALLWANGPMPGLLYWPPVDSQGGNVGGKIEPDKHRHVWLGHKQNESKFFLSCLMLSSDSSSIVDVCSYEGI